MLSGPLPLTAVTALPLQQVYEINGYNITTDEGWIQTTACDGNTLALSCDAGQEMRIHRAFYGRQNDPQQVFCSATSDVCDGHTENNVTARVQEACGQSRTCHVMVCRGSLGLNQTCSGIHDMYLQVAHECVPHNSTEDANQAQLESSSNSSASTQGLTLTSIGYPPAHERFNIGQRAPCSNDTDCETAARCYDGLYVAGGAGAQFNPAPTEGYDSTTCPSYSGGGWPLYKCGQCRVPCSSQDECALGFSCIDTSSLEPSVCEDSEQCGVCLQNTLCQLFTQFSNGLRIHNRCYESEFSHKAQYIMQCQNVYAQGEECLFAMDHSSQSGVRFQTEGASVVIQYPTAKKISMLGVFRPPTHAGGTETSAENIWFFAVQCFIGDTGGGADAALQDANWHTIYSNLAEVDDGEYDKAPGWKEFSLEDCPEASSTWRVTNMTTPSQGDSVSHLSLMELKFTETDNSSAVAIPRLGNVQMAVNDTGVWTTFYGATPRLSCASLKDDHAIFGKSFCQQVLDGDVNSPVIFIDYDDPKVERPFIEVTKPGAEAYESIWVYYHPFNHQGKHRRLRSFDAHCFEQNEWRMVLNQSESNTTEMFIRIDEEVAHATDKPCHSCWKQVLLQHSCTSNRWRIDNFNGLNTVFGVSYHMQETFVFEILFAGAEAPMLPEVKPARIQGWCAENRHVNVSDGHSWTQYEYEITGDPQNANARTEATVTTFATDIGRLPCASSLAVEMVAPDQRAQASITSSWKADWMFWLLGILDGKADGEGVTLDLWTDDDTALFRGDKMLTKAWKTFNVRTTAKKKKKNPWLPYGNSTSTDPQWSPDDYDPDDSNDVANWNEGLGVWGYSTKHSHFITPVRMQLVLAGFDYLGFHRWTPR